MNEIWKDISGYEGLYQVSNLGRIKSFCKWKRASCPDEYILKDSINNRGYHQVIRIGKRHQKIPWSEFDSLFGNYDITERLHSKFRSSGDFIGSLTELSDEYYNSIIAEENVDE